MNAISLMHIITVIALVGLGRLISFLATRRNQQRGNSDAYMSAEILTRIPLFFVFFISAAFAIQIPAINLGAIHIDAFAPATALANLVAVYLGFFNQRYGVLNPFKFKDLDPQSRIGVVLLYATAGSALLTLFALPAGGMLVQALAGVAGILYFTGLVLLVRALGRIFG